MIKIKIKIKKKPTASRKEPVINKGGKMAQEFHLVARRE
jgi:hypothetical protein